MRLGRTALMILGIGIFIIALVAIYYLNSKEAEEQARLNERLGVSQVLLPKLVAEKGDWQSKLTQAESEVAEAKLLLSNSQARFPEIVESFEYNAALFQTAYDCELQVVEIRVSKPSDEKVEGIDNIAYAVSEFQVVVQSIQSPPNTVVKYNTYIEETVDNMLKFIDTIATSEGYNTSNIKQVELENLKPLSGEELEEIGEKMERWPKATIDLTIYALPR